MEHYNVSPEYLDSLVEDLMEWSSQPKSLTIPQFLSHRGIAYITLKHFAAEYEPLGQALDYATAKLFERWLDMAMSVQEMPPHRAKVLMRYIRFYDKHTFDLELQQKERIAYVEAQANVAFQAENYSKSPLEGRNKEEYERNVNKRRGSSQA